MLVLDVDGTLVDTREIRLRMARGEVLRVAEEALTAPPIPFTLNLARQAREEGIEIVVLTARGDDDRDLTVMLLERLGVTYDKLLTQPAGLVRLDLVWKREAAKALLADRSGDSVLAIDDSPYIVDMWEQLSVPVIQIPGWAFGYVGSLEPELPEELPWTLNLSQIRQ